MLSISVLARVGRFKVGLFLPGGFYGKNCPAENRFKA
jgi:hypothetical protein